MGRADVPQHLNVLVAADHVDQADAVRGAYPHEHLAEIRRGGGVDERRVALGPHRLDHRQRGQRVDEQRGTFRRADVVGQLDESTRVGDAVVRPHRSTEEGDALADHRLGAGAGGNNRAGALVADRQRLVEAVSVQGEKGRVDAADETVAVRDELGGVGRAEQHAEVGRVDRRRLDGDDHLAIAQLGKRLLGERQPQLSIGGDQRPQRSAGGGRVFRHRGSIMRRQWQRNAVRWS